MKWQKAVYCAVPVFFILGVVAVKFGTWKGHAERDFVAANRAFLHWDRSLENGEKEFLNLQNLMKKHPELHTYYDGPIGQNFLALQNAQKASTYVERTLERTKQSHYSDYAQTSLEMGRGEYGTALQSARKLKEELLQNRGFLTHRTLFAFNLMRIAILCQEVGCNAEELEAWKELKSYGGWDGEMTTDENAGFNQLLCHFTLQETTLLDYIRAREEEVGTK